MNTPQKFRKKPVEIEAVQVPEGGKSQGDLMRWIENHGGDVTEGCGWIFDYVVTAMHARNPYKEKP